MARRSVEEFRGCGVVGDNAVLERNVESTRRKTRFRGGRGRLMVSLVIILTGNYGLTNDNYPQNLEARSLMRSRQTAGVAHRCRTKPEL